ncbi:hypothetical protein C8R47DRAFT_1157958 [Mycena vitilis]|nr:hypothetical protein C8R47DRAFT_1157958 [Mycena vitilis]
MTVDAFVQSKTAFILSVCTETRSLAIFQTPAAPILLPLLATMPLSRLSVGLADLFGHTTVDFGHASFARLTHLDIFEAGWDTDQMVSGLSGLPCLTHLLFNPDPDETTPHVPDILARCKLLQVLVVLFPDENDRRDVGHEDEYFSDDLRSLIMVVNYHLEDWESGQTGGVDYWIRAERFIQKRRSGEIKASEYLIPLETT